MEHEHESDGGAAAENPELEAVVDEATADGQPGQVAARREVERLEGDEVSPQDGLQM